MNSNSTWTFIVLNLPNSKGTLRRNKTKKQLNNLNILGPEKSSSTTENDRVSETKEGMPWC